MSKLEKQPKQIRSQITDTQQLAKYACRYGRSLTPTELSQGIREVSSQVIQPSQNPQIDQRTGGR